MELLLLLLLSFEPRAWLLLCRAREDNQESRLLPLLILLLSVALPTDLGGRAGESTSRLLLSSKVGGIDEKDDGVL